MAISSIVITTGAPQSVFTSIGSTAITTMYLCNRTTSPVTANLYLVPSAGIEAYGNCQIYSNIVIAANDTYILEWERILLEDGDAVQANSSVGDALVATTSYTGI